MFLKKSFRLLDVVMVVGDASRAHDVACLQGPLTASQRSKN